MLQSVLRATLRTAGRALLVTALLAGGYVAVSILGADGVADIASEPEAPAPATASAAARVAWLVERHACWTGPAPTDMAGRRPGHVVLTVDGKVRYSAELVDEALESVFGTPRPGLVVHAFCR